MLTRRKQLAIAQEATTGTAEALGAGDVVATFDEIEPAFEPEFNERTPLRSHLSPQTPVRGIRKGQVRGKLELVGGGDAVTLPPCDRILLACGMRRLVAQSATVSGGSGTPVPGEQLTNGSGGVARFVRIIGTTVFLAVESGSFADLDNLTGATSGATIELASDPVAAGFSYLPVTETSAAPLPTFTCQVISDGLRDRLVGALGTCQISAEQAGALAYLEFTLMGSQDTPTDAAEISGASPPSIVPETFLAAGLALDGDSLVCNSIRLDMQNEVSPRRDANSANGIQAYRITNRAPQISIDPEAQLEGEVPFYAKLDSTARFGFTAMVGQSAGKRMVITAPAASYSQLGVGDRDGNRTYDATLALANAQPEGDDELMLSFI